MKNIYLNTMSIVLLIILSCSNQVDKGINILRVENSHYKPKIINIDFPDYEKPYDSLYLKYPVTFLVENKNDKKYRIFKIMHSNPYLGGMDVYLNNKYYIEGHLGDNCYFPNNSKMEITIFVNITIPLNKLKGNLLSKAKEYVKDNTNRDSIILTNLPNEIKKEVDKQINRSYISIYLRTKFNSGRVNLYYCFKNNNSTIYYNGDSILKANPRFRYECK